MIRYPGSKDKIADAIIRRFPDALSIGGIFNEDSLEYREPFFGGGAVGFRVLDTLSAKNSVWLNDKDFGISCLWNAVYTEPAELARRVRAFIPSTDHFYRFREEDAVKDFDILETAFRKLALHQMSFSGLGVKAGGPIGGREQSSAYNVNCRWNASRLCRDIQARHRQLTRFDRVRITSRDFSELISGAPAHAFIYADPPYVVKGEQLYKHPMTEADHQRLGALLQQTAARWVLSYDDHELVHQLYGEWACIENVELTYTTARTVGARRKNSEVIVSRRAAA